MVKVARAEVDHPNEFRPLAVKPPVNAAHGSRVGHDAAVGVEGAALIEKSEFKKVNSRFNRTFKDGGHRIATESPVVVISAVAQGAV